MIERLGDGVQRGLLDDRVRVVDRQGDKRGHGGFGVGGVKCAGAQKVAEGFGSRAAVRRGG
ncbi:hypothetical protein AB0B85_00470 [Micromonospora sp. NPDC049044]|uniref:hypothetical protein n=1 Tax=Micromonospora sp. NPDC049044 TaxID=3154827 RepID=UPI0033FA2F17